MWKHGQLFTRVVILGLSLVACVACEGGGDGIGAGPCRHLQEAGPVDSQKTEMRGQAERVADDCLVPRILWQVQLGTEHDDVAMAVGIDDDGSIYAAGVTKGSLAAERIGEADAFVVKYSLNGALLWQRQFGAAGHMVVEGLALDSDGACLITGNTAGDLEGLNAGQADVFVAKYDGDGAQVWMRQFGTEGHDTGADIAVDGQGNCYIVGTLGGVIGEADSSSRDVFVAKYSADGEQLWLRQFDTDGVSRGAAIAIDVAGQIRIGGRTEGSIGGQNRGSTDAFFLLCDGEGELLLADQFGTSSADWIDRIAIDCEGNCYVSAETLGTWPNQVSEVRLARYGSNGQREWLVRTQAADDEQAFDLSVDEDGDAYIAGSMRDMIPAGDNDGDVLVMKYDSDGRRQWLHRLGTDLEDTGMAIAVGADGHCYVAGWTRGALAGDSFGGADAFIIAFSPPSDATGKDSLQSQPADSGGRQSD